MRRTSILIGLAFSCAAASVELANAAIVVGGSALLDQTYADQLQDWLGEGPITLTNIYAKQAGHTSADFHAAADGQGRTFSVMEVLDIDPASQIVGGYNPQSWHSAGSYNVTVADALRTAFLFNLTTSEIQRQNLSTQGTYGHMQTFNDVSEGPTFGYGYDLSVDVGMNRGYFVNLSYGGTEFTDGILAGGEASREPIMFGRIEIFTIAAAPVDGAVPEPGQLAVWTSLTAIGLGVVGCQKSRSRRTR